MTDQLYFSGIPTEPEVKSIRCVYPEQQLKPDQVIRYEDIEAILGYDRHKSRFRTVTNKWRRDVQYDTGDIIIGIEPGVGFKILNDSDKLSLSTRKLRSAVRLSRRSWVVSATIDTANLTEADKATLLSNQQRNAAILGAMRTKNKTALPTLEDN